MSSLIESLDKVWRTMKGGTLPGPTVMQVEPQRCFPGGAAGQRIRADAAYFTVRINEMHLAQNRQWYTVYDPVVLVAVEFGYNGKRITIANIVGPNTISGQYGAEKAQHGTVLQDTRIAGPFPYRGGDVDVSVSLYQVQRNNYGKTLLNVLERLSSAAGVSQLGTAVHIGSAIMDGVEALIGLQETVMLAGHRISLATSHRDPFSTGYYAMFSPPAPHDVSAIHVKENRLFLSDGCDQASTPYRASDFVLLGISSSASRDDISMLPFYELKAEALKAVWEGEEGVKRAKGSLIAAYQQMRKSPDVIADQAGDLFESWLTEFAFECQRVAKVGPMPISHTDTRPVAMIGELNAAVMRLENLHVG